MPDHSHTRRARLLRTSATACTYAGDSTTATASISADRTSRTPCTCPSFGRVELDTQAALPAGSDLRGDLPADGRVGQLVIDLDSSRRRFFGWNIITARPRCSASNRTPPPGHCTAPGTNSSRRSTATRPVSMIVPTMRPGLSLGRA